VSLRPENNSLYNENINFFKSEEIFEAVWRKSASQQAGKKSAKISSHSACIG
jgi:hypothetical protein